MLGDRDPPHYLAALKTTRTPKRLLWLDCEGMERREQSVTVDRWARGILGTTHFTSRNKTRVDTMTPHETAEQLWRQASDWCTPGRRVVLFGYDLAYQLRVSRALIELPLLGWHLDRIVLERTASWALFRNGKRSLMCCDLMAWANVSLETIQSDLTFTFMRADSDVIPVDPGPPDCYSRAVTIRAAVMHILEWVNAEQLGPFRPTGSGQSYAAFRRQFLTHKLLVHDDAERLHAERVAMWTGRCEAWQHGHITDGPFVEYDMRAAYCRIAAECEVPAIAARIINNARRDTVERAMENFAVLAECTITTDVECVPAALAGRTVWPVGQFRTVIWDPEIRIALANAHNVKFHTAWLYYRAPALQSFATAVLDGMDDHYFPYHPVVRRVMKHWSRCLVGRLGLRFRAWHKFGTQDTADLRLITYIDVDAGTSTDMLIAGHDRLILSEMAESTESLPQVPSWVMSECRRRLWEAMALAGRDRVIYCDTDSLILGPVDTAAEADNFETELRNEWAIKARYVEMNVRGPRNYTADETRHVSGLPRTARQVAPLEFSGQVMRGIKESMRAGELDCVATLPRTFVLDAPDLRRQHLPHGETIPFRVNPTTEGK